MKLLAAAALCAMFLASCNTIEGIGQDVRSAGEWTADTAKETKDKMD